MSLDIILYFVLATLAAMGIAYIIKRVCIPLASSLTLIFLLTPPLLIMTFSYIELSREMLKDLAIVYLVLFIVLLLFYIVEVQEVEI